MYFTKPIDEYRRQDKLMAQYYRDNAKFISVMTGYDLEYADKWVREQSAKGGKLALTIPEVSYTERQENYDRIEVKGSLLQYINYAYKKRYIMTGVMTTYLPPEVLESPFTGYINYNKKIRSGIKKKQQDAKMAKNKLLEAICKAGQLTRKGKINSISGGQMMDGCAITLPTAHPTLTVTTRIDATYADAVLDRFVSGNRHYHSYDVTLNAIVNITTMADIKNIDAVLKKYGLHYPTPQEAFDTILYSARLYWKDILPGKPYETAIMEYLTKCTDAERAAVVYVGDFYQLNKYNPDFCRAIIVDTMNPPDDLYVEDPESYIKNADSNLINFAVYRMRSQIAGIKISDLGTRPELQRRLAQIAMSMHERFTSLHDIIFALWSTPVGPHSLASYPDAVRRAIPAGDTDSAFVTVGYWVELIHGDYNFSDEQWGTAGLIGFMATSAATHQLLQAAANLGAKGRDITIIDAKNEYGFMVFMPTQASKHYFAAKSIEEGNVLEDFVLESKGVSLISEDAPKEIVEGAIEMQNYIIGELSAGRKISLIELCTSVADTERRIIHSILSGEGHYFKNIRVNTANAYKNKEENATYKLHKFWNDTYGKHHNAVVEPPYVAKVVKVDLDSAAKVKDWLSDFDDQTLATVIYTYMEENNMLNGMGTIRIPDSYMAAKLIPPEIAAKASVRSVVQKLMARYYLLLEIFGQFSFEGKASMLLSDTY